MQAVYRLGLDAWGTPGAPIADYLALCEGSPKYRRGNWRAFHHDQSGELIAALICYEIRVRNQSIVGIGSIATAPDHRRQGHGREGLVGTIECVSQRTGGALFLLFADSATSIYAAAGFKRLAGADDKRMVLDQRSVRDDGELLHELSSVPYF